MRLIQAGTTDQSITFRALTSAGATATPAFGDAGISATYKRDATGAATAITPVTQTSTGAHTDGGLVHIGGGVCRLDLPDAAVADGATRVTVTVNATAWVGFTEEILLVDYDPTGPVTANVTQISGDSAAADNLEAAADGSGYNLGGGSVVAASVTGAVGSVTGAVGSVTGNVGGNVTGSVGSVAAGGITAASIATGAVDADALAADAGAKLADIILRRTAANIEASANGDALSVESVYGLIMAAFESAVSATTWTIRQTGGSTLGTKTVAVDSAADPIVSVT